MHYFASPGAASASAAAANFGSNGASGALSKMKLGSDLVITSFVSPPAGMGTGVRGGGPGVREEVLLAGECRAHRQATNGDSTWQCCRAGAMYRLQARLVSVEAARQLEWSNLLGKACGALYEYCKASMDTAAW